MIWVTNVFMICFHSCFVHSIIGYVTDELISRGVLEKTSDEKPLTNGVFYVEGKYMIDNAFAQTDFSPC